MRIGLKDLFFAKILNETEETTTYEAPKRMGKAMSADLTVNVAETTTYADDTVDNVIKEFTNGEIKLVVNDLAPAVLAEILGCTADADGVLYSTGNDKAPYVAVGFRSKRVDGTYKYLWLYKVQFGIPSESFATKGESIEIKSPEISGKVIARNDGKWKADYVGAVSSDIAKTWFDSVREQNGNAPEEQQTQGEGDGE